jgi:hypothetical protein
VARGYFLVSRLHATESHFRSDRLHWRPVLELVSEEVPTPRSTAAPSAELSPDRRVWYLGRVSNAEVFGSGRITDQVPIRSGINVKGGRPDWLQFQVAGRVLLLAAGPVRHRVSWDAIAEAGAALGDDSLVRVGEVDRAQSAEVADVRGCRYRVRLMRCGMRTHDEESEWNQLIGGLHQGDGDFLASRDGRYGWISNPFSDEDLSVGEGLGRATWCQERDDIAGVQHAVNRGYFTVSRFHLTRTDFTDAAFGWRPVLERIIG